MSLRKLLIFCILTIFAQKVFSIPAIQIDYLEVTPNLIYGGEDFYASLKLTSLSEMNIPVEIIYKLSSCDGINLPSIFDGSYTYYPKSYNNCTWTLQYVIPKQKSIILKAKFTTHPATPPQKIKLNVSVVSSYIVDVQTIEKRLYQPIYAGSGISSSEMKETIEEHTTPILKKLNKTEANISEIKSTISNIIESTKKLENMLTKTKENVISIVKNMLENYNKSTTKMLERHVEKLNKSTQNIQNKINILENAINSLSNSIANLSDRVKYLSMFTIVIIAILLLIFKI